MAITVISPFEAGFIVGMISFIAAAIWFSMNRHVVRSKISAAPVPAVEISRLRRAGHPVSLLVDAHIEVIKCGYDCDIAELARLYREIEGSRPNSHALRRSYIDRVDRLKAERGAA